MIRYLVGDRAATWASVRAHERDRVTILASVRWPHSRHVIRATVPPRAPEPIKASG